MKTYPFILIDKCQMTSAPKRFPHLDDVALHLAGRTMQAGRFILIQDEKDVIPLPTDGNSYLYPTLKDYLRDHTS